MTGASAVPIQQACYSGKYIGNSSRCVSLPTPLLLQNLLPPTCATDRGIKMSGFKKRPVFLPVFVLLALLFASGQSARAQTLKAVMERGTLNCGVGQGLLGFSSIDDKNVWSGFDVD